MKKIILSVCLVLLMFGMGFKMETKVENIGNYIIKAESMEVITNGKTEFFGDKSEEFKKIQDAFLKMIKDSHEMPAFGVSSNKIMEEDLKNGLWLVINFGKELIHGDMPFSKLYIKIEKDYQGFNLIRYSKKYEYNGRCFYLDLKDNTMKILYDCLTSL